MQHFRMASKTRNHERAPDKKGFSIVLRKTLLKEIEEIALRESRTRNGQIEFFLLRAVEWWRGQHALAGVSMGGSVGNVAVGGSHSPNSGVINIRK
jgi:hypothetical protein